MSQEITFLKDEIVKKGLRIEKLETESVDLTSEVTALRSLLPQVVNHSPLQTVTASNQVPELQQGTTMEASQDVSIELPQGEVAVHSRTTQNTGVNNSTPTTSTPQSSQQQPTSNTVTQQQQQQSPPHQGQNNSRNGIQRGPRKVDQIFIHQVDPSYNSVTLKDQIQVLTNIDRVLIKVEYLFTKNNSKAFKIVVPQGKMQQTIKDMGNNIKAEPYKERNHRPKASGRARGSKWDNTGHRSQGNNQNTFLGLPYNYGWDRSLLRPEWQYYGQYYRPPQGRYY